jgi:multidrug efflux pump subunit AcrA (membrane-fusion protein)
MKFVYLDKKDRIVAWFTPGRLLAGAGVAIVLFALPVWRDSVSGKFLLEPRESAVVRTVVPGSVSNVFVREGEMVSAGTALATLHSLPMEAEFENAKTRLVMASERARAASLHYSAYGEALKEKEETGIEEKQLSEKNSALEITSPMAGTILTPRLNELVGTYLPEGALILEIGDLSVLKARIYISEYELAKVREGARARIQIQGKGRIWNAQVSGVAVRPSEMDPRLLGQVDLKGMNPPHFYLVDLVVTNADGELKPGMMGVARVYSERRSLFALGWEAIRNFFGRKIW